MIWDEFLRHFRFCDEEDSGLSDDQEKLFGEIQNSFLQFVLNYLKRAFSFMYYIQC